MRNLPAAPAPTASARPRAGRYPVTLIALFVPGGLFALGLFLLRDHPRYHWLGHLGDYPFEFWVIVVCGGAATAAGVADRAFHRSGRTAVGAAEHHSEVLALVGGGLPLFALMAAASVLERPGPLLVPVLAWVLFTAVLICYDEFVFHRKRCGRYETLLHRVLVLGNGLAWLAWMNWCFARGGGHG
jgi:hypothetical protein